MTGTPIENLKSALKEVGKNYADDFCAGWNLGNSGYSLESTKRIQDDNKAYRVQNQNPELVTTGMVDGWNARKDIYPELHH